MGSLLVETPVSPEKDFIATIGLETDLQMALGDQKIDILLLHPGCQPPPAPNREKDQNTAVNDDIQALAAGNREKALRALALVTASLADYRPFDPAMAYTPKALEPYDALAGRFDCAVECCLRFFRSHELAEFAEQSDTTRSLLNRMEKLGLISQAALWLAMRNVRNRIVHDYLLEQTAQMFAEISGAYGVELKAVEQRLAAWHRPVP